jgi:16S rRNA (uracil1498-N3)-methyltransferase
MIRLYLNTPDNLIAGASIALEAEQARYLVTVMRQKPGDEILIFNGRDGEWRARISDVGKKSLTLEVVMLTRPQPTATGPVLLIALIKRNRLETIIEKATELGVVAIQPVITRRTIADHTNIARLQVIAQEAAEQTERLDVPEIREPLKLEAWLKVREGQWLIFADEMTAHDAQSGEVKPMLAALKGLPETARTAILIGPEGGFDAAERETLRAAGQTLRVNLGPRILRADTAAIAALTMYQAAAGDWQGDKPGQ